MTTIERLMSAVVDMQHYVTHDVDPDKCAACPRWDELQSAAVAAADEIEQRKLERDALHAEVERLRAEVNEFRRVLRSVARHDVGDEWDGTKMCHTPLLKIEFSDVPAGEPNTAVGWLDRDAFSASIDAARGES